MNISSLNNAFEWTPPQYQPIGNHDLSHLTAINSNNNKEIVWQTKPSETLSKHWAGHHLPIPINQAFNNPVHCGPNLASGSLEILLKLYD